MNAASGIKEKRLSEDSTTSEASVSADSPDGSGRNTDDSSASASGSVSASTSAPALPDLEGDREDAAEVERELTDEEKAAKKAKEEEEKYMEWLLSFPAIAGRYTDADPDFANDVEDPIPPMIVDYYPKKYNRGGGGGGGGGGGYRTGQWQQRGEPRDNWHNRDRDRCDRDRGQSHHWQQRDSHHQGRGHYGQGQNWARQGDGGYNQGARSGGGNYQGHGGRGNYQQAGQGSSQQNYRVPQQQQQQQQEQQEKQGSKRKADSLEGSEGPTARKRPGGGNREREEDNWN